MVEAFKEREKKPDSPVVKLSELELHNPLDTIYRASSAKPKEAYSTVRGAEDGITVLANQERYDNPANPIGRRFVGMIEKLG
jgi:hypothetical protein